MDKLHLRLLDANFNRAREALRVLEDYARFILDDPRLSGRAKQLRHDLTEGMREVPFEQLLGARDIQGDVGTDISTETERSRRDDIAVVQAAGKRLTEALRCLEEYSKIDHGDRAVRIETLRYRAYDLEQQILLKAKTGRRFHQVRLYVILTEELCEQPILEVTRQVLEGGANCLQLREKGKSDLVLLETAVKMARMCREAGALFIMNDRPDLAVLSGADGVHVGQEDLPVRSARKILSPSMIVGKSTHTRDEAEAVLDEGTDYLAVGSIFASPTKPEVVCAGTGFIEDVRRIYHGPLIAIGGITPDNASLALAAGASGVAVCQAVLAAKSPYQVCRELLAKTSG